MELELEFQTWKTEDETIGFSPNSLWTTRISQGKRLFLPKRVKPVHDVCRVKPIHNVWVGLAAGAGYSLVTWEEVEDGTCA